MISMISLLLRRGGSESGRRGGTLNVFPLCRALFRRDPPLISSLAGFGARRIGFLEGTEGPSPPSPSSDKAGEKEKKPLVNIDLMMDNITEDFASGGGPGGQSLTP